jgi:patched 1 protein
MVSVHSTYNGHSGGRHNSSSHEKKRRKNGLNRDFDPDLLTRTAWTDASVALKQIKKGKATGNKASLWLRAKLQSELFKLGCRIQRNAGSFLFVGLLILGSFAVCLKSATMESRVEKLWVEAGGRLQQELEYVEATLGVGAGATNELIIQTPSDFEDSGSVLTSEALLTHLDVIKAASRVVVEKEDVTWQLSDLCYAPTIPLTEIQVIDQILDKLFPCAIITPLDCFWEGSKLLGPNHPVHIPLGSDEGSMLLSWTTLNPLNLVQQMKSFNFNFDSFEDFMKRVRQ